MICGTIHVEGQTLHFILPNRQDGEVIVRVQESLDGEEVEVRCSTRAWAASLALLMDFDGMEESPLQAGLYELAETIPFPSSALRWIP